MLCRFEMVILTNRAIAQLIDSDSAVLRFILGKFNFEKLLNKVGETPILHLSEDEELSLQSAFYLQ